MKVIILAAGYGTRLQRDIRNEPTQTYKHLLGVPKPLVPVGGQCLISRWMRNVRNLGNGSTTNHNFVDKFRAWAIDWPEVHILDDGTCTNEGRLGAIADINLCLNNFQIHDDLLIIGGDTLFYNDFDLNSIVCKFNARKLSEPDGSLVTCYQCEDSETTKFGILEINEDNMVVAFLEKPQPTSTSSRWACPCFYVLSKDASLLIPKFLQEKVDAPLSERDATGHLIQYLQARKPVFVIALNSGRFDIGSLQSYIECDRYFSDTTNEQQGLKLC